ncbi:MAG: AIR synthase-related protein, partial [Halanaerobium sp.]
PYIFELIQKAGEIEEREMYRTFNMGIGMVLVIKENEKSEILSELERFGEKAQIIGKVERAEKKSLEIN